MDGLPPVILKWGRCSSSLNKARALTSSPTKNEIFNEWITCGDPEVGSLLIIAEQSSRFNSFSRKMNSFSEWITSGDPEVGSLLIIAEQSSRFASFFIYSC
ncbi:hypothetical protein, partial [Zhouia amylolytica]|uniref:hypothetical protein n=1 Tax=Zhouia amylolytica TaxID=376730 RepID=UPI0020CD7467